MNPKEQLIAIRDLLKDKRNWCMGALARDNQGNSVNFDNPKACQWCLAGAFMKITGKLDFEHQDAYRMGIHPVMHEMKRYTMAYVNDHLGYITVMDVLNKAIERIH